MAKIKLNIEGMHCPSCEILIGDALKELNGMKKVKINHKLGSADVEFDESQIGRIMIIETIKREGFKVRR